MTLRRNFLLGACAVALPLPALAQVASLVQQRNVIDTLAAAGNYNNFIEIVSRAGLVETLKGAGPFTLLAPNNAAMARMPNSLREMIDPSTGGSGQQRQDPDRVRLLAFVNMHIINGRFGAADLAGRTVTARTHNGNTVEINSMQAGNTAFRIVGDSGFGVGGITVRTTPVTMVGPEILASNGVVLPISEPLIQ